MSTGTTSRWRNRAQAQVPWLILVIVLIALFVVPVQAALNPDFTGTPRSGVSPLTVQFTDTSTGFVEPVTYLWDFGDGNISSAQNPVYTYNQPGSYTVTLAVSNASGAQATLAQNNYITIEPPLIPDPLIPDFTGTPSSGVSPLTVQFTDASTGPFDRWDWDFGDGNISSTQNPLYTYNLPGSFTVSLTVSNTSGEQATLTHKNYITVESPLIPDPLIPDFTGTPRSGVTPLTVQFNDSSTGPHDQWEWEFGDGNTSAEQKPLYTYNNPGSYNVKLIISNSSGEQATIAHNDYITVNTPAVAGELVLDFNATPRSGVSPLTVKFNDTSTGFLEPVTYLWDFGDGSTSPEQNPLYTFEQLGSYSVTLTIGQVSGALATITQKDYITVTPAPAAGELIPEFIATPRSGVSPLTVQFNDTSTGFTEPVTFVWDFGDGNSSSKQNPQYIYYEPGSYTVKLDITNASGEQATIIHKDYITVDPAPAASELIPDFIATPLFGVSPLAVKFNDRSTGFVEPVTFAWDFGNGNTSAEQNPLYSFEQPGSYSVSLTIGQASGALATISKNNYITITAVPLVLPVADFFGTPTSGVVPLTVTFTDLSTNTPITWNWSFGDDSLENATEQNPVHTFANPGTYIVSLNATNADGSDSQTRSKYITVNPAIPFVLPNADFFGMPTSGVVPLTVTFSDVSTNNLTSWNWSFGDDSLENATEQNPVHTYEKPGTYTVSLNATNADGSDTQTRTEYIAVNSAAIPLVLPVADFSADLTSGVAPLIVTFTDLSTNTPSSWNWLFGDDSLENATEQNPVHTFANPGTYTISLNATNADGSDTKIQTDYISVSVVPLAPLIPEPLIPNFIGTPMSGPAPLTVQFNDTSTGLHDQWVWEFGDGNTSSEQNPLYIYNQPGTYSVTLNVSQVGGESVSTTQKDYITVVTPLIPMPLNSTPLIPNFTGTPMSGPAPLIVQFNDTSTGPHDQWVWEFGDGNTSSEQNPLYIYNQPGSYSVLLNVSQEGGDSVSTTQENYITVSAVPLAPPVADFSGDPTSGVAPLTVTFTDSSTNTPTNWDWTFGDDSSENVTVQNPVHTYTSAGNYTVSLNATNTAGLNITTKTSYINVIEAPLGPVADFSGTPTSGVLPLTVQFNDTSTGFVNPVTYLWDFGDGGNSTERNPSHTYTTNAQENYTVTLNVTGNYGKTDTIIKSGYINLEIPTIEITVSDSPTDQSLLSNEAIPPDQSLPQAQSLPQSNSGLSAQSLPQSRSILRPQSLPQGISGYKDQSLPQDISTQKDMSAANEIDQRPRVYWSLEHGQNTYEKAFWMKVLTRDPWVVNVYDAMNDFKPFGTVGKMAEYNLTTKKYITNDNFKSLKNALQISSDSGSYITLSGLHQPIQSGDGWDTHKYDINLKQYVDSAFDTPLGTGEEYRIVITFEALTPV